MTDPRRVLRIMLPISPSISSGSSNGERVRISVLKVIDFAPNCYAENWQFSHRQEGCHPCPQLAVPGFRHWNRPIGGGFMAGNRALGQAADPRRRPV